MVDLVQPLPARVAPFDEAQPTEPMSFDDYLQWSERAGARVEWVEGWLAWMGQVNDTHQMIGLFLIRLLGDYVEHFDLGRLFYSEFLMYLGHRPSGREPDLFFVRRERLTLTRHRHFPGAADLVIEIVSPWSRRVDRVEKFAEYEAGGVREYWIIDPGQSQALFFQMGVDDKFHAVAPDADGRYLSNALPNFWLKVDWLLENPTPRVSDARQALGLP